MITINRACILCGSHHFRLKFSVGDYHVASCRQCGLTITLDKRHRPARPHFKTYKQADYQNYYLSRPTQERLVKRAGKRLREIEIMLGKRGSLLDVGCGYGTFLHAACRRGWKAVGIEPVVATGTYGREKLHLPIITGTLAVLKINKRFDVITYWDVLEHTLDPITELRTAGSHLTDSGLLAIQVPNIASPFARLAKRRWSWLCMPDHLYHFKPSTIRAVVEKAGFTIVNLKTWSGESGHTVSFLNVTLPEARAFKPFKYVMLKMGELIDMFLPFIAGFINWLQSCRQANGLIIVYAKKKTTDS